MAQPFERILVSRGMGMKKSAICAVLLVLGSAMAGAQNAGTNALATSRVFTSDQMIAHAAPNGSEVRVIFTGTLATGEAVGAHQTMQPAGTVPNQPHKNQHSELMVVVQGTVAFEHDGKAERVGAGEIVYVAMGTVHAIRNVGDGPAKYVVIQIGGDTKK